MTVLDQAQRLKADGKLAEAVGLVEKAAREGDGEALHAIAHWRLFGIGVKRDPGAAHALLEKAGAAGCAEAIRTRAVLIANGTGCTGDPERARALMASIAPQDPVAARQIEFLPQMMPVETAMALPVETLCEDPLVRVVRGLLLPDECLYLMERAEPLLQPSFIVDPATGKRGPHPVRTSAGMNFGPTEEIWSFTRSISGWPPLRARMSPAASFSTSCVTLRVRNIARMSISCRARRTSGAGPCSSI